MVAGFDNADFGRAAEGSSDPGLLARSSVLSKYTPDPRNCQMQKSQFDAGSCILTPVQLISVSGYPEISEILEGMTRLEVRHPAE